MTSSERPNGIPSQLINHYEGYIDWSFVTLRPALYQFLRLALASCPADSSISPIIDTWIDFVAPWRYIKPVDKKTIQFSTTSNFGRLDAASQARSSLSKSGFSASFDLDQTDGDIVPANSELQDEWSEYVVANVLFYTVLLGEFIDFSLSIVRGVESVVSGEKAGAADAVERALSPIVISLLRIISMACLPVADVLRATEDALSETGLHRSTILTSFREQLSALEVDNFRLRLLFEPLSVERVKAIILGLDRIFRGMRYEEPRLLPPSEAFREGCDPAALISQTRHNLLALFHLKNADIMQDEELSQYIHNEKPADQGSSAFRRIRGGASDRLSFKMKSSPLRIGNQKSLRAPKLIRTYESKWLVYLTSQLEIWLDARLAEFTEAVIKNLADRSIPAPRLLRALACYRFDLRFLAAYSNIVLLLVSFCLLRLALRLLLF